MKKSLWILFAALSIVIGLYPILYFLIDPKFGLLASKSDVLLTNRLWQAAFYTHILLGGFALLIGWTQFLNKLRIDIPKVHRVIGKLYVVTVAFSGLAGFYIALFATGGIVSKMGFISLSVIWLITTYFGFLSARDKKFVAHQKWMIYSFAACFAAVTLRLWLPLLILLFGDFIVAYRIVAWLCWVPNLIVAFFINRSLGNKI